VYLPCFSKSSSGAYYVGSRPTSLRLQGHMHFALHSSPFAMSPIYLIFHRAYVREAKECLIHALMYLNDMLGYRIGDVHYTEDVMAHNND